MFGVDNIGDVDKLYQQLTDVLHTVDADLVLISVPTIKAIERVRLLDESSGQYTIQSVFLTDSNGDRVVCYVGIDEHTGEIIAHYIPLTIVSTMDVDSVFNFLMTLPASDMNIIHVGLDDLYQQTHERIIH